MRAKGQITVFISLTMMCIFTLICGLLESARTAGARHYLQTAMSSTMDSVFSQYHREMWDSYRLLFAEYEDEEELKADFEQFLLPYLEVENWYPMRLDTMEVLDFVTATDDHGEHLEQEILDYMKYGIWNQEFEDMDVTQMWKSIREADGVKQVAQDYRSHAKDALRLEKALEQISDNQKAQERWRTEGLGALERYDEGDFQRKSEKLIGELKAIPRLVDAYCRQADALQEKLKVSRENFLGRGEQIGENAGVALEQEIKSYEEYVAYDGERRLEIEALRKSSKEQIAFVEALQEEAREVARIIDEWESDDEDDEGPDLESLWSPVESKFFGFRVNAVSFSHGVKDKEREGWLNQVVQTCQAGLLNLVLPEGEKVSGGTLDKREMPSETELWTKDARGTSLVDHMLVNAYCGQFLNCFTRPKMESEKPAGLIYEMEYLFDGKDLDEENLGSAVTRLVTVREGLNLLQILSDEKMRTEARGLAILITGAAGITPLTALTTFFVMSIWALGEAIADVRGLLGGKSIPLWKSSTQWKLSLEELLAIGRQGDAISGGGEQGLRYDSWLKILLMTEDLIGQEYRLMDMIQMNIQKKQESFRMRRGLYQAGISSRLCGKHVFFSLGFVDKISGNEIHTYELGAAVERSY